MSVVCHSYEDLNKPSKSYDGQVSKMRVSEPWTGMFIEACRERGQDGLAQREDACKSPVARKSCSHQASKYGFHRPVFHDGIDQSWFEDLDRINEQKGREGVNN